MARCLVTGHRGYIGSRLYEKLQELGHEVQGVDLFEGHDIGKAMVTAQQTHMAYKN